MERRAPKRGFTIIELIVSMSLLSVVLAGFFGAILTTQRMYTVQLAIALATALFGVVVVTVLAMGMWTIARVNNFSAVNREDAARALNLAEAGVAHALSLLRGPLQLTTLTNLLQGSDFAPGGGDDFLLIGHGLPVADMIPPEGV